MPLQSKVSMLHNVCLNGIWVFTKTVTNNILMNYPKQIVHKFDAHKMKGK